MVTIKNVLPKSILPLTSLGTGYILNLQAAPSPKAWILAKDLEIINLTKDEHCEERVLISK